MTPPVIRTNRSFRSLFINIAIPTPDRCNAAVATINPAAYSKAAAFWGILKKAFLAAVQTT